MTGLAGARRVVSNCVTQPVVRLLAKTPLTPNAVSWLGFLITVGAAALIGTEHLLAAGVVVLFAGVFDMLDGALARHANQVTPFGAVLDATLDRVSEAMLLLGLLVFYLFFGNQPTVGILLVCLALVSSPLVSYVRARAEGVGIECQVGLFTRAERVITLAAGLLLSHISYALIIALAVIAAFSFITAGQRLYYVRKQTKK